jgi:thymidylate synthase (FAD)
MNIAQPYAKIIKDFNGIDLLRKIEFIGRISHRSEDAQTENSWERFIESVVMKHGDWSITEHACVSVDFYIDRGITHELVRHRIASYTQESTRFVNYEKKMPPSFVRPEGLSELQQETWEAGIDIAESYYRMMLSNGCTPQIARSVFPNALASRVVMTANLRNWRHVFMMRTTKETHPQMKQVMIPLLEEFKQEIPILYADIESNIKQSISIARGR